MGRYYWLKIGNIFIDSDEVRWLEEQGRDFPYLYIKLCVTSLRHDGMLIREIGNLTEPLTDDKLAELLRVDEDTMAALIDKLLNVGLLEQTDDGYHITKLAGLVGSGSDSPSALRQQRWRDRQKENSVTKNNALRNACHNERKEEREKIKEEREIDNSVTKNNANKKPTLDEIKAYIAEKNLLVDGDFFFTFFSESNWHDSRGNKVKSWKLKLQTWHKMELDRRAKGVKGDGRGLASGNRQNKQGKASDKDGTGTDWSKERAGW